MSYTNITSVPGTTSGTSVPHFTPSSSSSPTSSPPSLSSAFPNLSITRNRHLADVTAGTLPSPTQVTRPTHLLLALDEILFNRDLGLSVAVVFLDFSKAFDVVSHQFLIRKLRRIGVGGMDI
eukprot:GHVN01026506.1.p2 GENE.GHVN01026506.1~~GHVN01026506.1.p2  ORF type:complete len:122 (-),score=10.84 GHVN01026506.1:385-750(-)